MATISVIIPTLNRPNDLQKCLASIASNTRQPDEIIIVEQGDIEMTKEAVRDYSLPIRVEYLTQKSAAHARNYGVEKSVGEILVFIDDDVEVAEDYLQVAEQYFADDTEKEVFGIVGRDEVFLSRPRRWHESLRQALGVFFWRSTFGNVSRVLVSGQNVLRNYAEYEQVVEWCLGVAVWRREAFADSHCYEDRFIRWSFGEDVMFSYQLYQKKPDCLRYVPTLKYYHYESQVNRIFNAQATRMMIVYRYIFWKECVQQGKWWRTIPYLWSQLGFCLIELLTHPRWQTVRTLASSYRYLYRHRRGIINGTEDFNSFILDDK